MFGSNCGMAVIGDFYTEKKIIFAAALYCFVMLKKIPLYVAVVLLFASCAASKNLPYFQDTSSGESMDIHNYRTNVIKPGDMLSIIVSSSKPELAVPYNLFTVKNQFGTSLTTNLNTRQDLEGYMVDSRGYIDYPVLGEMKVEGMTREQLSRSLKERLESMVPNVVVTVSYLNFKITVIGEVNRPGTFTVEGDRITVLEALGLAGDMSVYGKRRNVLIIRENAGTRQTARLDMKSKDIFESPYFYLQQNDVVYVEPLPSKTQSISTFRNYFPTFISLGSLITTIVIAATRF